MVTHDRGEYGERIAILETEMTALLESHKEQAEILKQISRELTRYKGFIGGIMFIISAIFTFFKAIPMLSGLFNK